VQNLLANHQRIIVRKHLTIYRAAIYRAAIYRAAIYRAAIYRAELSGELSCGIFWRVVG